MTTQMKPILPILPIGKVVVNVAAKHCCAVPNKRILNCGFVEARRRRRRTPQRGRRVRNVTGRRPVRRDEAVGRSGVQSRVSCLHCASMSERSCIRPATNLCRSSTAGWSASTLARYVQWQLSLAFLRGRLIEYQLRAERGEGRSLCGHVCPFDPRRSSAGLDRWMVGVDAGKVRAVAGPDLSVWRPWAGSLLKAPTHRQMP